MKARLLLVSGIALALVASTATAATMQMIAPVGADTVSSGRTVLPNGIVVGQSGSANGIIWDATNGSRAVMSAGGSAATVLTGAGYRTVGGQQQLVVHGLAAGGSTYFFSNDNGATWLQHARLAFTGTPKIGTTGTMRSTGTTDEVFGAWSYDTTSGAPSVQRVSGAGDPPLLEQGDKGVTTRTVLQSMSATGKAVGMRRDSSGQQQNYIVQWNGPGGGTAIATYFKALNAASTASATSPYYGQAWAVNDAGTKIFGMSPVTDGRTGNWPYIYDVATATATELKTFPNTGGSSTNALPYCSSQSGDFAAGQIYRGTERAALWNTVTGTATDLTSYAQMNGVLDGFTRLARAYGVAEDGMGNLIITGNGVWSPDGGTTLFTRGFVLTMPVPEPVSAVLLALGGLLMIRRPR